MTQPNLFQSKKPRVTAEDVAKLIAILTGKGWLLRKTISRLTGWNERTVREIAANSSGQVIGSPDRGYAFVPELSHDEYEAAVRPWLSQIRQMKARIAASDTVFYGRTHQRSEAA